MKQLGSLRRKRNNKESYRPLKICLENEKKKKKKRKEN